MNESSTKGHRSSPTRGRWDLHFAPTDLHFDGSSPMRKQHREDVHFAPTDLHFNESSSRHVDGSTSTSMDRPSIECFDFVSKWVGLGFVGASWNGCRWVKLWLICCWFGFGLDFFFFFWFVYLYLICSVEIVVDLFIDLWFDFGCDFGWFRVKLLRWVWLIGGEVVAMGLLGRKLICRLCWCWLCWINMLAMGFGLSWMCVLMSWMGWLCQMCYCHEWVGERKNNI